MPSRGVTVVALALCLLLAGCVTTAPAGDSPSTAGPESTADDSPSPLGRTLASCSVPEPVSPTPTTEPGTPSPTGDLSAGLEVASEYDGNLTVVLRRLPRNVTTFARRYPAAESHVNLGPEMADRSSYWTVVVADCAVVWNRPVRDYEAISIRVHEDGTVTVEQVVES